MGSLRGNNDFRREVGLEVQYLTTLHGEDALRIAREKAERPLLRTARRKILEATVRELETRYLPPKPRKSLLGRLFA
jgi:hypothetical protein